MPIHRVPTNVQKHRKYISFMDIHVYNKKYLGKHIFQTNPPKFDERLFSVRHTFVQTTFETGFYVLRQGVPEGRSSEEYASFKQVKSSWPSIGM